MKNITATLIAFCALITSVIALVISVDWSKRDVTETTPNERIEVLEREISHLRGTVYQGNLETAVAATPNPEQNEAAGLAASEQERINHTVESMRWTMTVRGMMPPTNDHLEIARRQIFDDDVSVKRKLVALRVLKTCDKRSDEVARKMIETYYQTSDFNMQAEIFNQLDGMDTPELVQALLEASSTSPNARVRKEAVDALSGFLPDPDLLDWLKQVSSSDPDKDVRREAERLLKKHQVNISN